MKWTRVSLASLLAAGSVVIACSSSSTTVETSPDSGVVDAGKPDTSVAPDGATPIGNDGSSPGCPGPVTADDIIAWKAPKAASPGSCSPTDMANLTAKFNDDNATYMDIYTAIGATCQACVFSNQADTNWQEIVWSPDMASGNAFVNFGACYDLAPGGSAACGKGVQDDQFCYEAACPDACTDQMGCSTTASSGVCMMYDSEVTSGCGSAVTALDKDCSDAIDAIQFQCGNGTFGDGGAAADSGG